MSFQTILKWRQVTNMTVLKPKTDAEIKAIWEKLSERLFEAAETIEPKIAEYKNMEAEPDEGSSIDLSKINFKKPVI